MPLSLRLRFTPRLLMAVASIALLNIGVPALAQNTVEGRVDRLEKEMRAVQRKVFPGGAGQLVVPDVTPTPAPTPQVGSPATGPLNDLTARVNAIESQLARLTGQVEENGYRLRQLEEANMRLSGQVEALQAAAAPSAETGLSLGGAGGRTDAAAPARASSSTATTPKAESSPARLQAVAAVERPSTGNAAQDSYTYGYRLWVAKFYPEAQAQLEDTLAKFGKDPVASRAGNLLGRAYLDDGKPTQAAKVLYENYQARPKGDRAAESLAWIGEALIQLKKPKDACIAYEELEASFGADMPTNVREMMSKGKVRAKCA